MHNYMIKNYQKGFEQGQASIGISVARNWRWPFAYDLDDLLKICSQPDFDPETHHYCFIGDEMVGYVVSQITSSAGDRGSIANLELPRVLPGHQQAAELLLEWAIETLKRKGVSCVVGRLTTMCPGDIRLAEKMGFSIREWGYKVYYSYEMKLGRLNILTDVAEEIDPADDLDDCANFAAIWYKRPVDWCRNRLQEWHERGVIAHLGVRTSGKLMAACLVAPNDLQPSIAADYYIYTPDEHRLKTLLASAVAKCIDRGVHNLIADLINEHRQYEPVYEDLGFKKVADWARFEKILN